MTGRPVRFRHRLEYGALRVVIFFAGIVPESVSYRVVAAAGRLFYRCSARRRQIALRMLTNAMPDRGERELHRIGRVATGNIFKVFVDMLRLGNYSAETFAKRVTMSEGSGDLVPGPVLGVTAHLGSWEVAAVHMARRRGVADVVVQTFKNPLVQRFLQRSRGAAGLRLHPRRGGIRGLARALADGGVGLQAVDQNQRLRGVFTPFFGEIASCERSAATLARRKGYPIQIGLAARTGTGFRFQIVLDAPIHARVTDDVDADVRELVSRINARLEALVLRFPEQYLWIHDRYRTRPEGERDRGTATPPASSPS